jgi:hypothetical protein
MCPGKTIRLAPWIAIFLAFFPSYLASQTVSVIFDDDPSGMSFRDASWGTFIGAGEYLRLSGPGSDKLPLDANHHVSGSQSGIIEWRHMMNGSWELFIASNAWQARDFTGYDSLVFYVNGPDAIPDSVIPRVGLESSNGSAKSSIVQLSRYCSLDADSNTWQRISIPFGAFQPYGGFTLSQFKTVRFLSSGLTSATRTMWIDAIVAIRNVSQPPVLPPLTNERLLDTLQQTSFMYFWNEANPSNGMIKDRSTPTSPASIAAIGFGLTAIGIGIDHGWISRTAGRDRVLTTIRTLWNSPQNASISGMIGYNGWFYHFLDMNTATRLYTPSWKSELSSIDTGLLLAGVLYIREYFDGTDSVETALRSLADSIFNRVDWQWMMSGSSALIHGWTPEGGMLPYHWIGYNEAMILYLLAIGSPIKPIPSNSWNTWASGYEWKSYAGYEHITFPALFVHQYSHCWVDFRSKADSYLRARGIDYFENSRRATLANRAYCIANPQGFAGYTENIWGLTACDGPNGYAARGGPYGLDDGTIAPTAAISSIPFTPTESMAAAQSMYTVYGSQLFGRYGFADAFNVSQNWYDSEYIGIDQGPIIIMIENHRTGRVWKTFMKNATIATGLTRAGFQGVTNVGSETSSLPCGFQVEQNYPNPFNPFTTIRYSIGTRTRVSLVVFDVLGRVVEQLVDREQSAGTYQFLFDASSLPSGIYFYRLTAESVAGVRRMVVVK